MLIISALFRVASILVCEFTAVDSSTWLAGLVGVSCYNVLSPLTAITMETVIHFMKLMILKWRDCKKQTQKSRTMWPRSKKPLKTKFCCGFELFLLDDDAVVNQARRPDFEAVGRNFLIQYWMHAATGGQTW